MRGDFYEELESNTKTVAWSLAISSLFAGGRRCGKAGSLYIIYNYVCRRCTYKLVLCNYCVWWFYRISCCTARLKNVWFSRNQFRQRSCIWLTDDFIHLKWQVSWEVFAGYSCNFDNILLRLQLYCKLWTGVTFCRPFFVRGFSVTIRPTPDPLVVHYLRYL